jgi:predicted acetyltransferase
MREIRSAQKGDIAQQKEIWKRCFGDSDNYIDFYYANRYKETETVLLLEDKVISSMLTMLPIEIIAPNKQIYNSSMLYAIATHPEYQNRGFANEVMDFTHKSLREDKKAFSVLVPSGQHLFDFYRRQGYQDGFYIREVVLTWERIGILRSDESRCCKISNISPEEYNLRRTKQLSGRLYVAYTDNDIAYQQKLSKQSCADIFGVEIDGVQGCVAIERLNSNKILIKELLISESYLPIAIKKIAQLMPVNEYVLRTPAFLGKQLEGTIRPFAVIKAFQGTELEITADDLGYLGFAFD